MAKHLVKTRISATCPIFGSAKDIISSEAHELPTYEDIMRCYLCIRLELKGDGSKQPPAALVAKSVAIKVMEVWSRASLPTVSHERIVKLILAYNSKYQNLIKPIKGKMTPFLKNKINLFQKYSKKLFDISSCKCVSREICKCEKSRKVPTIEWPFLTDQRSERKMRIGGIDMAVTKQAQTKNGKKNRI